MEGTIIIYFRMKIGTVYISRLMSLSGRKKVLKVGFCFLVGLKVGLALLLFRFSKYLSVIKMSTHNHVLLCLSLKSSSN